MKISLLLLFSLLLASCESVSPVAYKKVKKAPVIEYKPTDTIGVDEAKETLANNAKKRLELVKRGAKRSDDFEPLILSLIAFHNYDQELKLSDVSPFMKELPHIASISTHQEKEEFIRLGTADKISTKKLGDEASKGEINNKEFKKLKVSYAKLQKEIDSRVTEKTVMIGGLFMTIGGIIFAVSFFIPALSKKLMLGGGSIISVGGCIMAFGSFMDSFRSFMESNGNKVFWLIVIPLLGLLWIPFMKKADKAIDEIKSDDIND